MTDSQIAGHGSVEHHRAIDHDVRDYSLQVSGFHLTPEEGGRRIVVIGTCPGCGGRTTTTWDYGSGNGYKGILRGRRPTARSASATRTVCCDCGHGHASRPESAVFLGCGAYWQVELP